MDKSHATIIQTEDGSHSLHSTQFNQKYHSHFGALQESIHVFLKAGLLPWLDKEPAATIHVAELGFGSGLNAYLVGLEAARRGRKHTYFGLEKYPVELEQALQLNYPQVLESDAELFDQIHRCEWDKEQQLREHFTFKKLRQDIFSAQLPANHFHTFFYDAFSPDTQPELWTPDCLQIAYEALRPGGTLVTYCAKGDVKRALKSLGFAVEKKLEGPPGKREMTRATKT